MARLERVLGCTACTRSLAVDPQSGLLAYPAGSALVLVNPRTQCRANLLSPGRCQLTCLAWSPCGQFIATGEFGTDPNVRVWALRQSGGVKAEPGHFELRWHKLGISCVAFSPDSELLISVGNNHDKQILVWEWRTRRRLAESRLTCQVNAMAQAESGRMFVTVGVRHVKFWYMERGQDGTMLLQGRSAILAEQRNNTFIDCCCASAQRTFALTLSRLLVEFVDKRLVNLYQMGAEVPFALSLGPGLLFLGFSNGIIRALDSDRMEPLFEFGKPHGLHEDVVANGEDEDDAGVAKQRKFPDVHSLVFHAGVLTALYSDRSLYHWLLPPASTESGAGYQPHRLSSQLFHVGPIFDLEPGPGDCFFTAGADETVRLWTLDSGRAAIADSAVASPSSPSSSCFGQSPNPISPELRKMVFLSPEADSLTERPDKNFGGIISDTLESTTGVRCVRLSPGGEHLACGRKNGNICIFDLRAGREWPRLAEFEAHDGEVLCLEYSGGQQQNGEEEEGEGAGVPPFLLASASRDRLVHLFDAAHKYSHLLTLDQHRGPVTFIRFVPPPHGHGLPLLVSFGTDQLVCCHQLIQTASSLAGPLSADCLAQIECPQGTAAALAPPNDGQGPPLLLLAQDRSLGQFDPISGKRVRTLEGPACEDGARITKLSIDPSGTFAAALCSDRTIHLLDLDQGGHCLSVLGLPSDCVTAMAFSSDCRRLLLVSYSGCISVWRLSAQLHRRAVAKLAPTLVDNNNRGGRCCTSPEDRPDSLTSAGDDSLFGSLASLDIVGTLQHSAGTATTAHHWKRQQQDGDDELDSGIGGGGGGNAVPEGHQRFELKRLHPSESVQLKEESEENAAAGGAQRAQAEGEQGVPPIMLSSPSPVPPPSLRQQRHAPPPPYPAASNHHHLQLHPWAQQNNNSSSRSMSNLTTTAHSATITNGGGGQQQGMPPMMMGNGAGGGGGPRRKWNMGGGMPLAGQHQQQQISENQAFGTSSPAPHQHPHPQQQHFPSHAINYFQQPSPAPSPLPPPPSSSSHPHPHHLGLPPENAAHRFGITTSVSLNAIRAKLVDGQQQQQLPPAAMPAGCWSSGTTRNSLSRRFLQNGQMPGMANGNNGNNNVEQSNVWNPAAEKAVYWSPSKGDGQLMGGKRRSTTTIFHNNSPGGAFPSINMATSASPVSSSSRTSTTPSGGHHDFGTTTTSPDAAILLQNASPAGRRLFQSVQPEAGGSGGSGGARLALSRIKQQRRMAETTATGGGGGHQPSPLRSRSQSPSQLAMAFLAQSSSSASGQHQPRSKAVSPSGRSVLSTTSSPSSCQQLRLSSVGASSSRLQQARQRLKKSQENFAAALEADESIHHFGEGERMMERGRRRRDDGDDDDGGDGGPLARSRSIGNLLVRLGGTSASRRMADTGDGPSPHLSDQRQMAKSVTDLLGGNKRISEGERAMMMADEGGPSRLAECRQRLAQSIRDIRRISESDLHSATTTPIVDSAAVAAPSLDSSWQSPPGMRAAPRRGVQKKLDRQWPQGRGQTDLTGSVESSASSSTSSRALSRTANPPLSSANPLFPSAAGRRTAGGDSMAALRSASTLVTSSSAARSPRSNYLAQKLAAGRGPVDPTNNEAEEQQQQQGGQSGRSLSAELGIASAALANNGAAVFASADSKRMAMHAQECIREMQQACDKLLGTRQLIRMETAISQEEKRQLLASVNRAVAAFAQRLAMDEDGQE